MKRLQNRITESRRTLPITILYGIGIWLLAGLVHQGWWFQFLCFFTSVYTMVHLNNINQLIRIFSRSVSTAYIMLGCSAIWLFSSIEESVLMLCSSLSLFLLFACYQDQEATGKSFYIFFLISFTSLFEPHFLLFIPVYLLLMATTIYSLSFRTFFAALVGLITPYWLYSGWQLYINRHQPEMTFDFLNRFTEMDWLTDFSVVTKSQWIYLGLLIVLFIVGTIHFWITSYMDKIRVRQIYTSFIMISIYTLILIAIQPQKLDVFIGMMTTVISPITGHFFALTRTRLSNIFFIITIAVILLLTGMNLWISSSAF